MAVLMDTGFLFALLHRRDERHRAARAAMAKLVTGEMGALIVSDFVVDELFTLIRARGGKEAMEASARRIVGLDGESPAGLRIVATEVHRLARVAERFGALRDRGVSFTDASLLVLAEDMGVEAVATFDDGFQGLIPTVGA